MTETPAENKPSSTHNAQFESKKPGLSRRDFLKLGLGAAGAFALGPAKGGLLRVEAQSGDEDFLDTYTFQAGDTVVLRHGTNIANSNKDWTWCVTRDGETHDNLPVTEMKFFNVVDPLEEMKVYHWEDAADTIVGSGVYLGSRVEPFQLQGFPQSDFAFFFTAIPSFDGQETVVLKGFLPAEWNFGFSADGGNYTRERFTAAQVVERIADMHSGWQIKFDANPRRTPDALLREVGMDQATCDQTDWCRFYFAYDNQSTDPNDILEWQKATPQQRREIAEKFVMQPDGTVLTPFTGLVTMAIMT